MNGDPRAPTPDGAPPASPPPWRLLGVLMLLDALVVLPLLGATTVDNNDEGRFAAVAKEMVASGDWGVPRIGGATFASYPPLAYWAVAVSGAVFGWNEWAVRLPGALAGVLLTGLAGAFAWRLTRSRPAAACAAGILATTAAFASQQPLCRADVILMFFVTGAVYLFYDWAERGGGGARLAGFYLCLGLGVLAKGPLGIVLPGLAIGTWIAVAGRWELVARARPWFGIPAVAAMTVPWYWHFARAGGAGALDINLFYENLENFASSPQHPQPAYYYVKTVPPRALPWLLALPALARVPGARRGALFPGLWTLAAFAFLSAASAKRINYITYLCPPLAVLEGIALAAALDEPRARRAAAVVAAALAAAGAGCAASLAGWPSVWTARLVLSNRWPLAAAAATATLVFASASALAARGRGRAAVGAIAALLAGALALYAAVLDPATGGAGRRDAAFCRSFADVTPPGAAIGALGDVPKGHFFFYSSRPLVCAPTIDAFRTRGLRYGLSFESGRPASALVLARCPVEEGRVWTLWRLR